MSCHLDNCCWMHPLAQRNLHRKGARPERSIVVTIYKISLSFPVAESMKLLQLANVKCVHDPGPASDYLWGPPFCKSSSK